MGTSSKILFCSCHSEFSDRQYGKGLRKHYAVPSQYNQYFVYKCEVCGIRKEEFSSYTTKY